MRVLTVIDSLGFGGAERLLCTLAAAAPASEIDLEVASLTSWSSDKSSTVPRLREVGIEPSFVGVDRLADPRGIARLAAAIQRSDCDIVHAHLGYSSTLVPFAARLAGRPSVCTLHTLPETGRRRDMLKQRLCVESASRSEAFIFVSEAAQASYAGRYRQRPSWQVVHNGINLDQFHPGEGSPPAHLGVPTGVPIVSIIAALRAPKGHALAIAGWPLVLARVPDATLLIVGDGPEMPALRAQAQVAGLTARVLFTGSINDEALTAEVIRATDVVLLPSYTEALPTTLIEAAACGRPSVATDVGGVREVVEHNVTGFLVEAGDVAQMADAIICLLDDAELRRAMGRAAQDRARQHFDMYQWARRLSAVYTSAIGHHRHE